MASTPEKKLKVIITGATGMVGEGVLHECLQHEAVEKILVLGRSSCGISHPKLKEIIHPNFFDIQPLEPQLTGYNACFFCLGVSSIGMDEELYFQQTYILTLHFAQTVSTLNPGMVFCYVSGAGTDSTEKGSSMWARVKGKTENALMKLPFKKVYHFRPAIIQPGKNMKNTLSMYKWLGWLMPVFRSIMPRYVIKLKDLGLAMINVSLYGHQVNVLENADICALAKK